MNEKKKMKSRIVEEQMTDLAAKDVKPMPSPETKTFINPNKFLFMSKQIFLCVCALKMDLALMEPFFQPQFNSVVTAIN